ncbi:hypothetical protein DTO217A2_8695 [Paecilomyces variotii]|nr:hypothetical protein DTO217A2_8695 [Paecilomyces variotii]
MPSLAGLRFVHGHASLSDTALLRRKKKEFDSPNNVEIVRSLSHVRMPRVFQVAESKNSNKQGYESPDRIISLYSPSLNSNQNRSSMSDPTLNAIVIDGFDSEPFENRSSTRAISPMAEHPRNTKRTPSGPLKQKLHREKSLESTMRTSVHLDSSDESDADDAASIASSSTISPISDHVPHGSGTRWQRFFPELSSHFSLISSIGQDAQQGRVSPLSDSYHHSFSENHVQNTTRISESSMSSQDLLENGSSCYSRRSSITSVGSDSPIPDRKADDTYSVMSPTRAGVFDDLRSSQRWYMKSSREHLLVDVLVNKPLPEEPPIKMSPLAIRRPNSTSDDGDRSQTRTLVLRSSRRNGYRDSTMISTTRKYDLDALDEAFQRSNPRNMPQAEENGPSPSLTEAAQELEDELAKYAAIEETPDILTWPLQRSRGATEMVATRSPPPPVILRSFSQGPLLPGEDKQEQRRKMENAKSSRDSKRNRMIRKSRARFSFSVSGLTRRKSNESDGHFRSLSSQSLESAIDDLDERIKEKPKIGVLVGRTNGSVGFRSPMASFHDSAKIATTELDNNGDQSHKRRTSTSSEKLRLQLPRLQTERIQRLSNQSMESRSHVKWHARDNSNQKDEPLLSGYYVESPESSTLNRHMNAVELPSVSETPQWFNTRRMSSIYELDAGMPSPAIKDCDVVPEVKIPLPADIPEEVILGILQKVDTLEDLFAVALTNRNFYQTFKRHELDLMRNALFNMTPAAWELREMSPPWSSEWQHLRDPDAPVPTYTPSLYLHHYVKDIYTLAHVKSLLLLRCSSLLRRETVSGLAGLDTVRAAEIDDALWRIWTFCRIFGSGKGRENDIRGQIDWLNGGQQAKQRMKDPATLVVESFSMNDVLFEPPQGFAQGNGEGLSTAQLYDMTEIWTCLGVLLQPCYGMRAEARRFGVFDGQDMKTGDIAKEEAVLEEWTHYVLTLGLSAVLSISSLCPAESAETTFRRAQKLGLTKWSPTETGASRASFLKEAVSRAYKERTRDYLQPKQEKPSIVDSGNASPDSPQSSPNGSTSDASVYQQKIPVDGFPWESPDDQPPQYSEQPDSPNGAATELSPISNYPSVMNRLEDQWRREALSASGSSIVPDMQRVSGTNVFVPISTSRPMSTVPYLGSLIEQPTSGQILDPADEAIYRMVYQLGFTEDDAKWALKITDTGDSVKPDAAVNLLLRERKKRERGNRFSKLKRGSSNMDHPPGTPLLDPKSLSNAPGWRWA